MQNLPQWTRNGDTFWKRHYDLAVITEEAIDSALTATLAKWLAEAELKHGKAAAEPE